jgi:hypothetical protein
MTPVEQLLDFLGRAGEESTAEEVAELLWLAARLPARSGEGLSAPPLPPAMAPPAIPLGPARESLPPSRGEKFGQTATATSASAMSRATADLYPAPAGISAGGKAARSIRSPAALALPGSLELGRRLRPLKRRVPSRVHLVLDEAATAHRIADTGEWIPVFNAAPERWLDVVLVVDESSSMIIWQQTLAELQRLLERQGAFRSIEVLGFRAAAGNRSVEIYTGIGPRAERARLRRSAELIDPLGRRLIAVVSDCVSPVWHNGVMATLLSGWGQAGLATVVQVLPDHLWVRTGLRTYPAVYLRSPAPGAPNSTFEIEWTTYRPRPGTPRGVAVPVVSLEAMSLDHWSRAVAGNSNLWIPGAFAIPVMPAQSGAPPEPPALATTTTPPEQLVRLFYGTASPTARRLASFLAAVPLTLPVMRLVQRALLPKSRQTHLAEVWLSGLIDRPLEMDHATSADNVEFFFVNGVRELLLNNLRLGETIDVLTAVSGYVGERLGHPLDFGALIADPEASGDVQIAQGYQSFARVAASALRRFGGQYADLARRLEVSVYGQSVPVVEPATEVRIDRKTEAPARHARTRKKTVRVRALLVGTDEHASSEIRRLRGTANDLMLTRDWLQDRCGVSPSDIIVLLNTYATKQAIVRAWRQYASQMEDGDQLFFHFSGNDQAIASNDPNEADGLEETLFVYDSVPGDRATLLTHHELADLAAEVEQCGGQAIILLDSCRTASGLLARRALRNTLVFAGAAEAESSHEFFSEGKFYGAVSYFLTEAMRAYRPGMTWLDAHDQVLAHIRARGFEQTPQLIGGGDVTIFGSERKPVAPYLVVTKPHEREIEIHAPAALALGTGEPGARLAIYPPGSAMDERPLGFARVRRLTENGVAASLESSVTVPVASRVRVVEYGDDRPVIRVGMDDDLRERMGFSPLVAFERHGGGRPNFTISLVRDAYVIRDRDGRDVWRELVASAANLEARAGRIHDVLEHLAAYLRTFALKNTDIRSELAGKIDLELAASAPADVVTLAETEPLMLRLRNRAATSQYVSVWMLDEFLGIERIFPPTTSCVLLGKGREVTLAVTVRPTDVGDRPMRMTFKVFASTVPADLGLLSLPRLDQPFDLTHTVEQLWPEPTRQRKSARADAGTTPEGDTWVPGGPVAVTAKVWKPGRTLRVKFLKGDYALRKRVMQAAMEWTRYANVRFKVVDKGDAELRVGFDESGLWSYIGTDCLSIPSDQPTINLGQLTSTTAREEVRRVVLQQFGRALGLAAAHQSPVAAIPWNKKAAYEYYNKKGMSRPQVDANLFWKYDRQQVTYGPADPYSITHQPIPKEITHGKREIVPTNELSQGDKQFIARLYPAATTGG